MGSFFFFAGFTSSIMKGGAIVALFRKLYHKQLAKNLEMAKQAYNDDVDNLTEIREKLINDAENTSLHKQEKFLIMRQASYIKLIQAEGFAPIFDENTGKIISWT